ncbi:hypothetical protein A2U01_0103463, partial [Trifolium medium]|nr:hypothetical protein [Trifolium medium]
MRMMMLKFWN